jgi:hypothetical protein
MAAKGKGTDLTGELGRLGKRGVLPSGERPPTPARLPERPLAPDFPGILMWTLIGGFLACQVAFLIWLA